MSNKATIGVAHHNGWAVLVTVASEGGLIDRRRVELVDEHLPSMPYHCEGQRLPIEKAIKLVEQVEESVNVCAKDCLEALSAAVPTKIIGIAIRKYKPLPQTVAERIQNYQAMCVADSVMYRNALAKAAKERGWSVYWYDSKTVITEAGQVLNRSDINEFLRKPRESFGPPWQKDHRTAMAAAIAARA
ncbi:MAG: hypothetical protein COB53_13185 [Elusimicrobia bacterium]|nr:MAG: hypothetical protein COB53_13185 [Elusimicrobiota bacterium]